MLVRTAHLLLLTALALALMPAPSAPAAGEAPDTRAADVPGLPPLPNGSATDDGDNDLRVEDIAGGAARSKAIRTPIGFSAVGFSFPDDAEVSFRTSADGRTWSSWEWAPALDGDDGPDPASAEAQAAASGATSQPYWTGEARFLQVRVLGEATPLDVTAHLVDTLGISRSLPRRVLDAVRSAWGGGMAEADASPSRPEIVSRAQWGADESWRRGNPSYSNSTRAGIVHHTATSNDYSRSDAPAVIRAIYHYHTQTLGWSDIGYNLLVDRFGRAYEGRAGGVDRGVIGAHAGGFNTETFGVAVIGTFTDAAPPRPAWDTLAQTFAWKFGVHGIDADPNATVVMRSRGSTRYPEGHNARIHTTAGHRDVSQTACPGNAFYPRLPDLRDDIERRSQASGPAGLGPAIPLTGDWNGDGVTTAGWWQDGVVRLRTTNTAGASNTEYHFGLPGDTPVVGDWNGNGRDTVGVWRQGIWFLPFEQASHPDLRFAFGGAGDVPVAGDWTGDGQDGIGVVRNGQWRLRATPSFGPPQLTFLHGRPTDQFVTGDWNNDGRDTPGLVRDGLWFLRDSLGGGVADQAFAYGRPGDRAVSGSWLPGLADTAGFVRGVDWHLRHHVVGSTRSQQFRYER
jgi:hypothetical protein